MPIAPVRSNSVYLHSYTATPPIIDGNLYSFAGEWANAATQEFDTIPEAGGTSLHGKIYVMNTLTDLFIAIETNDGTNNGVMDFIQIAFDNDNDGTAEIGDDALQVRGNSAFEDMYVLSSSFSFDPIDHGSTAAVYSSGWTFEISHPLSSGETDYDFQLSVGDIVGFTLRYYDQGVGAFRNSYWPQVLVFADSSTEDYGDIEIDPFSLRNPVGGILAPVNKLNILAPYIALVGLIGIMSTIFAIRRWRKD